MDQTFAISDLLRVGVLAFLEMLLSADNAVVLGVLSSALPSPLRRRALFIGIASSFLLRAIALLLIAYLLEYPWIECIGAAYLVYLSIRFFLKKRQPSSVPKIHSFWKTVFLIEILDLIFAIDSIIAGVAFIDSASSKLWIVYAGGMIGLFGMRYAADLFSTLLDRFPQLEKSAYFMVGWIGIKLGIVALGGPFPGFLFWPVLILSFFLGFFQFKKGLK